jgi:NAD-dependent deacetylase
MLDDPTRIDHFRDLLTNSQRAVVFTGAGISTESGIPDFRSPGGVWDNFKPIDFGDFMGSEEVRREYWRRKFATEEVVTSAEPNAGHKAIARLVATGRVSAVITQNIDGLHQASGIPENRIIELHGNTTYAACLSCRTRYDLSPIREAFRDDETIPICAQCGGIVKPGTISFGQPMPREEMEKAAKETKACDLFIVIGSSLVVYPAAGFPEMAANDGAPLVILNREPTPLDSLAELVLNMEIGPTLQKVVRS